MGLLPCSLLRKRTRPRSQPRSRACRGSAAQDKRSIVLGAGRAARAAGPAAPIPAAATRSARPIRPHHGSALRVRRGEAPRTPGLPPGHASPHRPQPWRGRAERAPTPTRGLPALSPPGFSQRSAGPALQNGGGSLFAAAGPRRFHPPSWGNGLRAPLPARPPRMTVLTDAKREGARREPALNSQPTRPSTRLPFRFSSLDKMAAGARPARHYIRAVPPT